jgi:hypothetical protein
MPILDMNPGTSPEAPGTLMFYEQGKDPSTGWSVTSAGVVSAPGGQHVSGELTVDGGLTVGGAAALVDTLTVGGASTMEGDLTVGGYTAAGAGQFDGQLTLWSGDAPLRLGTAGGGIAIKEGADATMGVATLVAGAATVATGKVTATSRIFLTSQADGGTPGWLRVSARVAGASFTVTSSSAVDTSQVAWIIVEPAA